MIKILVIAIAIFSSTACWRIAVMKGRNKVFWGIMGFLFGPFAIAFLLACHDAGPKPSTVLHETVREFLAMGLLADSGNGDVANIAESIYRQFCRHWGNDWLQRYRCSGWRFECLLMRYGSDNMWQPEADFTVSPGAHAYRQLLLGLSDLSEGQFAPYDIDEQWRNEQGPVTVNFMLDGDSCQFTSESRSGALDMAVLASINALQKASEHRFECLKVDDQAPAVLWLDKVQKAALIRRGWHFL